MNNLQRLFLNSGLTDKQVHELTKISKRNINYYRKGSRTPNLLNCLILARVFNTNIKFLLSNEDLEEYEQRTKEIRKFKTKSRT